MPAIASLCLLVCVQAAAILLVVSGHRHRRDRRVLVHHLRGHRVLPDRIVRLVAAMLPEVSVAVGTTVLLLPTVVALVAPAQWPLAQRAAAALEGLLYLAFLIYLAVLRRRAPGATCGCLSAADERTDVAIARAAVACLAATLTAFVAPIGGLTAIERWPVLYLLATAVGALAGVVAVTLTPVAAPAAARTADKENWVE